MTDIDSAISKLVDLHKRLLSCFAAPTGVAAPRRPRWLEPTSADCDAALTAMVELERAKADIDALKAVQEAKPRPNFDEFSQALLIAAGLYSDVELAFWLTAPQPLLGMWTPIQLLARGDAPKLLQVMQGIEDGVYV